jgi:hypothetical protein
VTRLLSRAVHPDGKRIENLRSEERKIIAARATTGLTVVAGSPRSVTGPGGINFFEALTAARAAAKQASADGKPPPDAYKRHLDNDEIRGVNEAYLTNLVKEATRTAAEVAHPLPVYETKGGPLADRPQVARTSLTGKSREQAKDAVTAALFNL